MFNVISHLQCLKTYLSDFSSVECDCDSTISMISRVTIFGIFRRAGKHLFKSPASQVPVQPPLKSHPSSRR